jgi:hypothetical protein
MTPETLTCTANITPDQLSALRDGALPMAEAQRLREHISGCPACQARLADYNTLATALRQQRELEPGERIVEGVRARLASGSAPQRRLPRLPRPSRRLWAGLATLAPVAAIILLFVYVFGGLAGHNRPAADKTPTILPAPTITPLGGKHLSPTASPATVTLPPFTPAISAQAAWGALTPLESFQAPSNTGKQYLAGALSPDATMLAGSAAPTTYPTTGWPQVNLVTYDFASRSWRTLGPNWQGDRFGVSGGASSIDSRFIIYSYNDGHGQTCGVCHNHTWAHDRQTGATWEVDPKKGEMSELDSGDHVVIETASDMQFILVDLATRHSTPAIPQSEQAGADIQLVGFSWPYLIYSFQGPTPSGQPLVTTLRLHNELTNTSVILPEPLEQLFADNHSSGSQSNVDWATLVGDTLYFTTNTVYNSSAQITAAYGSLYRVSHFSTPGGDGPQVLARWQSDDSSYPYAISYHRSANARLITLNSDYVWDIAEGKLVQLNTSQQLNAGQGTGASLSGKYLLLVSESAPNSAGSSGAVYDTTTLPIH